MSRVQSFAITRSDSRLQATLSHEVGVIQIGRSAFEKKCRAHRHVRFLFITAHRSERPICACTSLSCHAPQRIRKLYPKLSIFASPQRHLRDICIIHRLEAVRAQLPGYTTWQACRARLSRQYARVYFGKPLAQVILFFGRRLPAHDDDQVTGGQDY